MFNRLRERRRLKRQATRLYGQLVSLARTPTFYEELAVPDDVDGRFDMIIVYAHLLFRRFKAVSGEPTQTARRLSQYVFDYMIDDMDRSLREIGVGDMSVGKHMKKVAKAFYGRTELIEEGIVGSTSLSEALQQTVYRRDPPDASVIARMAEVIRTTDAAFAAVTDTDLLSELVVLPEGAL